ncbi:MAG TPA: TylF/MycF/NovP-related O-methyltransferase [Candidatus Saccharimonadales bacterium]|nr:TylF/MycF/NovP-related O-methyltransferase [Candidatus Saccharimonadales bacterium]
MNRTNREELDGHPLISDQVSAQDVRLILTELEKTLRAGTPGDIVEFGCYIGTTSLFIRRALDVFTQAQGRRAWGDPRGAERSEHRGGSLARQDPDSQPSPSPREPAFHVYDSFAGLPQKAKQDQSAAGVDFRPGELAVSKKALLAAFQTAHLQPPIIHKAWFHDLTADNVPAQIAFAFLDGDFYDSIMDSLKLVWPRMSPGGRVLIDDYQREALPGVTAAVHDFFRGQPPANLRVAHNIAIIEV